MVKAFKRSFKSMGSFGKRLGRAGTVAKKEFVKMKAVRSLAPIARQVKALVAGHKKDAQPDIDRDWTTGATAVSCLTSSTAFTTAATATGVLECDTDSVLINHVRIKGQIRNFAEANAGPTNTTDRVVRAIVVWFYKPLVAAAAGGALPAITTVLVSDAVDSMPICATENAGRFTILSDRRWNLGTNVLANGAAVGSIYKGNTNQQIDYTVKVNKRCHFKKSTDDGTNGGFYDSASTPGQVDKGLLCMYWLITQDASPSGNVQGAIATRLNYTA